MNRYRVFILVAATVSTALLAYACGDGTMEPPPLDPPQPTTVTVSPATAQLTALGATIQLSAEIRDQHGEVMGGAPVSWASASPAVATVDAAGLVTAVGNGTASITASAGSASGSTAVTVAQSADSVAVSPPADLTAVGATVQLAAEAFDANGHAVAEAAFSWASSDDAVATVDAAGLVTAIGNGTASITASAGSAAGSVAVTVAQSADSVVVSPPAELSAVGATVQLAAEAFDANGHVVPEAAFSWASSDDAVATVDAAGLVTAVGNGAASITASAGSASGSTAVTVAQSADSVAVSAAAELSAVGATVQLAAEAFDANGHAVPEAEFSWASSDDAVATVDAAGLVTAAGNGTASITASAGSASGSVAVTVAQSADSVAVSSPGDLTAVGATTQLAAEAFDANGHAVAEAAFSWASSDDAVATVDAAGVVTAVGNGTAMITASAGSASGSVAVTVAQSAGSVAVSPAANLKAVGATVQLAAEAFDANGHAVAEAEFSWASSDDAVATVDAAGLVTAVGRGMATITATAVTAHGMAEITVVDVDVGQFLKRNPQIAAAMRWRGTDRRWRPYSLWPLALKRKLALAVDQLLGAGTGLPDVMTNRANGGSWTILSKEDAEDLYVANIAHSLLLEMAGTLPWSLDDLSEHELHLLLSSDQFYSHYGDFAGVRGYLMSNVVVPAPPEFIWDFMISEDLVGGSRYETIIKTLHWARYHLYHKSRLRDADYEYDVDHWDYRGGSPVARVLAGTTRKRDGMKGHATAGCHGTNWLLIHVLRAVNIPVEYVVWARHAIPSFPSEGLYLSHGDDLYSQTSQYASPFPEPYPTSEIPISEETYREWFSKSNSDEENLYNVGRRTTELAVKYLPQWLLVIRCQDRANGLSNEESRVYRPGTAGIGRLWTVAELEAMRFWERMDAKIAQYGGCSNIRNPRYRGGDG